MVTSVNTCNGDYGVWMLFLL